jgi:hypothetical protein
VSEEAENEIVAETKAHARAAAQAASDKAGNWPLARIGLAAGIGSAAVAAAVLWVRRRGERD